MNEHQVSEDRLFFFDQQEIVVHDFAAVGYILDIGGGGEGIIGRLKGEQVIAIDTRAAELEEAPSGPLKIVMDATTLNFLDETFNTVTAFFSLMYIPVSQQPQVFQEIFRVLVPGGHFLVWDVVLPESLDETTDFAVFPLFIKLPNENVETGYGTHWPKKLLDVAHYVELAQAAGFEVVGQETAEHRFFLELYKPLPKSSS
jgi:ubiquinone/menaquinone biosynthesis C-methylase UbiE